MSDVWQTLDFRHELTDMPERRLDPPDVEPMTPEQEHEQRAQIIRDMPLDEIADMIADAAGELAPMLNVHYTIKERMGRTEPTEFDCEIIAKAMEAAINPRIEAYIEHQLTGRVTGD